MATTNTNVVFGTEWGRCETCSRSWPVFRLRRHPRFGTQCLPDCWDGGPHVDENHPRIRPNEEVRMSDFPVVVADEGIGTEPSDFVFFDQNTKATKYLVEFNGTISFAVTALDGVGGWNLDGLHAFWVQNGQMQFGPGFLGLEGIIPKPSTIDLAVVGGQLVYTP